MVKIKNPHCSRKFSTGCGKQRKGDKTGDYQLFFLWKTVKNKKRNQQAKIAC